MAGESGLRADLFDRSVDEVMRHLEGQAYFESLVSRLESWIAHADHAPGETLAEKGLPMEGVRLVTWGSATEAAPASGMRVRCLEPGCVIGAPAAFDALYSAPTTVTADSPCRTATLTREMRERLEKECPELALEFFGYLVRCDAGATGRR
jgi:hypothetical protein